MKPWIWMRVASGLYAFFAFGHTYGFNFYPTRGPDESSLFSAMQTYTFPMQGFTRSHWLFYRGFGHLLTVGLLLMCLLCWLTARLTKDHPESAVPFLVTLLLASAAMTVLAWVYFFAAPATTGTLATLCILAALFTPRRA